MRVFVPCRFTLGDVLSGYFCPVNYGRPNEKAQLLMRLRNAVLKGACTSAFVVGSLSFWQQLDFPLPLRAQESFDPPLSDNGWTHVELEGHRSLLRPPPQLFDFPPDPLIQLPLRRPNCRLPSNYILFSDGAGADDRGLEDRRIVEWLKSYLPVLRIGSSHGRYKLPMGPPGCTPAEMDLVDATDLTQVFWLAKHARLIVSSCTYLRTMSALVGTPVVELLESNRAKPQTVSRTIKEYCGLEYGMRPGEKNFWSFWDGQPSTETRRHVEHLLSRT